MYTNFVGGARADKAQFFGRNFPQSNLKKIKVLQNLEKV